MEAECNEGGKGHDNLQYLFREKDVVLEGASLDTCVAAINLNFPLDCILGCKCDVEFLRSRYVPFSRGPPCSLG